MMKKTLVVFVLLISSIQTSLLSQAENENRLAMCGRKFVRPKVFQGRVANQTEAPWAVMLLTEVTTGSWFWKKTSKSLCSGSAISPRHILTASHCFSNDPDENRQRTLMNSQYDEKNCDSDSNYALKDRSALNNIHVYSIDDQHKIIDGKNIEKVTMVRGCIKLPERVDAHEDFAIIHLIKDLTFSDTLQPICVAYHRVFNKPGMLLESYGFGADPLPGKKVGEDGRNSGRVLRHQWTKVIYSRMDPNTPFKFVTANPAGKTILCPGDSGGGTLLKYRKQAYIVGVAASGTCFKPELRGSRGREFLSSVGFYANTTCQLTGVCEANMYKYWFGITDPPTTTTSTTTTTVAPTTTISTTTEPSTTEDQTTTISSTTVAPTSTLTSKAPTTISSEAPVTTAAETTTELELITQKMYYRTDEEFEPLSLALSSSAGALTISLLVFLVLLLLE